MRPITRYLLILLALLGGQRISFGQSVTVGIGSGSGIAGSTINLPITLGSFGGAQTAGLQWSFSFSSDITIVTVVAGPSATNAGKSISCSGNNCLILGFNATAMADGTVAIATFQIAANPSTTSIPIQISGVVASTAAGNSIPASGGTGTISLPTLSPGVGVGVSPSSVALTASQSRQFTATVTGSANTSVNWSMNPSVGSLSNGLYTAPSVINTAQSVTITVTSVADSSKSASATVQLTPTTGSVSVGLSPLNVALTALQSRQFTATVTGNADTSVNWSMNPSVGSLSNGLYTAPALINSAQSVTITATSVADSSKSSSATVQLVPGLSINLNPPTASLSASQSLQLTATVTGNSNTAVGWSMTPSIGTLSNGLYVAPSVINSAQSVTVTATSIADSSRSAFTTIQLLPASAGPVSVSVSPLDTTLSSSQHIQFTSSVVGSSDETVTWSMTPPVGTLVNGLYTAPSNISVPQALTITATSVADPSKSASAAVQLQPPSVSVGITPPNATLAPGQSVQFVGSVTGNSNTSVTWSMTPSVGTLSNGLYTAPAAVDSSRSVTVTATSAADPSKSGSSTIQLLPNNSGISVRVSPSTVALTPSQNLQFTAAVSGTSDTAVVWSKSPGGPGDLSATGLYAAPSTISGTQSITITATLLHSGGSPVSASAVITLSPKSDSGSPPVVTSVINGASLEGGPISPGEIIAIQGTGLSSDDSVTFTVDASGMAATTLAGTRVLFNGVPAALLFVQANQINLIVPYFVTEGTSASVAVEYQGRLSNPITIPVVSVSPALFTLAPAAGHQNQGAILNQDGSANSADNPAAVGDSVSIYATGVGQTNPGGLDGQMSGGPPSLPLQPVSIQIGGIDSAILRASVVAGVLVIDVRVPASAPRSGAVPVVFRIGNASSQPGVVMGIK